jgi:hypothetical protein
MHPALSAILTFGVSLYLQRKERKAAKKAIRREAEAALLEAEMQQQEAEAARLVAEMQQQEAEAVRLAAEKQQQEAEAQAEAQKLAEIAKAERLKAKAERIRLAELAKKETKEMEFYNTPLYYISCYCPRLFDFHQNKSALANDRYNWNAIYCSKDDLIKQFGKNFQERMFNSQKLCDNIEKFLEAKYKEMMVRRALK